MPRRTPWLTPAKGSPNGEDADRGQLILITGLLIAVMFVVLVLLFNTQIFTQNLASRGSDIGGRDAIEFQRVTVEGIQGLLKEENEIRQNVTAIQQGYDPSRAELVTSTRTGIEAMGEVLEQQHGTRGTIATIREVELHNGTGIHQPADRLMTSNQSQRNWTLASNVQGTRNFSMIISDNLTQTSNPSAEAFRITASNGSASWSLYVYENSSTGDPDLSVKNGSEMSPTRVNCSKPATLPMEINVTGGEINGTSCAAIQFGNEVVEPYSISYTWGNRSSGTYELTVNSTTIGNVNQIGSADSPFQTPAIYSAHYTLTFQSDTVEYRSRPLVAPE